MQNYKIEKRVGRATFAKLAEKFPDKQISWISISEGSTKSYKEFCKEYPELIKRVQFTDDVRYNQINNQSATGKTIEQSPADRLVNSNGNIEEISKALDDTSLNLGSQTFKNLSKNSDEIYNQFINSGITDLTGLK